MVRKKVEFQATFFARLVRSLINLEIWHLFADSIDFKR